MPHKTEPSKAEILHLAAISAMSPAARFGLAIQLSETLSALNRIKNNAGAKRGSRGLFA